MAIKIGFIGISIIFIMISSCSTYVTRPQFNSNTYDLDYQGHSYIAIEDFKYDVFVRILKYCYQKTETLEEINKVDLLYSNSDFYWPYMNGNSVDSIAKEFYEKIPPYHGVREYKTDSSKNYYLRKALNFYESSKLDSLARHYTNISDKDYKNATKIRKK